MQQAMSVLPFRVTGWQQPPEDPDEVEPPLVVVAVLPPVLAEVVPQAPALPCHVPLEPSGVCQVPCTVVPVM